MKIGEKIEVWIKEISEHKLFYSFFALTLFVAFFVRVYRIGTLLGFYYDQGRDALIIWDLWHKGKLFLIGPTTGIEGVFRGPWYYWFIAIPYLLGEGDPVFPSVFLSLSTVAALLISYKIGERLAGKWAGILTLIIGSFSYYLVLASRWLSNPTPMFLVSMLFVYFLLLILEGKKWAWVAAMASAGFAMQFGSAAEVFYFLAMALFGVFLFFQERKKLPNLKLILLSLIALGVTFAPQVVFDIRHQGILRGTVSRFLFQEGSFKLSFWQVVKIRLPFYYDVFFAKLFPTLVTPRTAFALIFALLFLLNIKKILGDKRLGLLTILLLSPLVGMLFFQGNYGNVYDYYFTGYYLVFVLFFVAMLMSFSKRLLGKLIIVVFVFFFIKDNGVLVKNYITSGVDGPTTIALGNEKQALDWIYLNTQGQDFNTDVYVPPVIPYAYDYLFEWYGGVVHRKKPAEEQIPLLYTIYEVDPPHPERLTAWLKRQAGIGKVEEEATFGGITVQRRTRLNTKY